MLAFGAVVGRRRQNNPWFAAKLRVGFAADGPLRDAVYQHVERSRSHAQRIAHHAEWRNGNYWYGPCSFDLTIQTRGDATFMKSIELLSTPWSPAETVAARLVRHRSVRCHRHRAVRWKSTALASLVALTGLAEYASAVDATANATDASSAVADSGGLSEITVTAERFQINDSEHADQHLRAQRRSTGRGRTHANPGFRA